MRRGAVAAAIVAALCPGRALADPAAQVVAVGGEVRVERAGGSRPVAGGAALSVGDVVVTGERSTASVRLPDGSLLVLGERSRLVLSRVLVDVANGRRDVSVLLEVGEALARVARMLGVGTAVEIRTPRESVRSHEGELVVRVDPDGRTTVEVRSGSVEPGPSPDGSPAAGAPEAGGASERGSPAAGTPAGGRPVAAHGASLTRAAAEVLDRQARAAAVARILARVGVEALGVVDRLATPLGPGLVDALPPVRGLELPALGRRGTGGATLRGTVDFR